MDEDTKKLMSMSKKSKKRNNEEEQTTESSSGLSFPMLLVGVIGVLSIINTEGLGWMFRNQSNGNDETTNLSAFIPSPQNTTPKFNNF